MSSSTTASRLSLESLLHETSDHEDGEDTIENRNLIVVEELKMLEELHPSLSLGRMLLLTCPALGYESSSCRIQMQESPR
jgi:hypothetical protein